jgi:putative transposase
MEQRLWLSVITCLAYCTDKELYQAIDYLREQVRILVEHQEKQDKRIRLINSQRMRVAAKAKRLSRKRLEQCTEPLAPDTIMRWFRELVAQTYDGSQNRISPGRPQITEEIVNLVIRFKEENPRWGYKKIRDQIVYLGYKISTSSVTNILIENGYDPEPDLTVRSTWHELIKSHWEVLAACDFFTLSFLWAAN